MKHRFLATICVGQDAEDPADWDYLSRGFPSYRLAEAWAEKHPKALDPWVRIAEQFYNPNYYEAGIGDWEDHGIWVEGQRVE